MAVVVSDAQLRAMEELLPQQEDLLYEEELARNPYNLKMWIRYVQARTDASPKRRYLLYERALRALPGSYKVRHRDRAPDRFVMPSAERGLDRVSILEASNDSCGED
jgi:hypothetical protein